MSTFYVAVAAALCCAIAGMPPGCWAAFLSAALIILQIEKSAKMIAAKEPRHDDR